MNTGNRKNFMKKLVSLAGVLGVSVALGLPAVADIHTKSGDSKPAQSVSGTATTTKQASEGVNGNATTPKKPAATSSGTSSTAENPQASNAKNIVALAAANDSFKTLTAAVEAAGLTETLSGKGPYTLFAPTDAAFAALPKDKLEALMKPENKDKLVKLLSYHVVPGEVTSDKIKPGAVATVEGSTVQVKVEPTGVMVNDAKVLQADVDASNGVIHVVDKVIIPEESATKK